MVERKSIKYIVISSVFFLTGILLIWLGISFIFNQVDFFPIQLFFGGILSIIVGVLVVIEIVKNRNVA